MERTIVVIPAYQAQRSIGALVQAVVRQDLPVVVVDDASTDDTEGQARKAGATVVRLHVNRGKGAALRIGFSKALEGSCDWVLTMDSDGQHLPSEISKFLEAAQQEGVDIVVGNRMGNPGGMPLIRRFTNHVMSWLLSRLIRQDIPDSQCGFRLIHRRALEQIHLTTRRFEIESELVVKGAKAGFKIVSIPVSSLYPRGASFIRPFSDTVRFFRFLSALRKEPS